MVERHPTRPDTTWIIPGQNPDAGPGTTWHGEEPEMPCEHCHKPIAPKEPYVSYNRQIEVVAADGCIDVLAHEELDRLHLSCDEACQHSWLNQKEVNHDGK